MNTPGTVLVVDDTPADLQLLVGILTAAGHDVWPADSGELALAAVAVRRPELILLDRLMPDLDGFEVCRRLKAREETRDIPLIFLSAVGDGADRVKGFELGAVDCIAKPIESRELLARVRTHLDLRRLQQRARTHASDLQRANERLEAELNERRRNEAASLVLAQEIQAVYHASLNLMDDAVEARARAEEAGQHLQASHAFNVGVLDSMADHIAVLDAQGVILTVNRPWLVFAAANGAPGVLRHWVGRNYLDICQRAPGFRDGEEANAADHGIRSVLSGKLREFQLVYPCHSPSVQRWFQMRVSPLQEPHPGVVIAHKDFTTDKLAEDRLRKLSRIVEQAPLSVVITDLGGMIEYVNPRFCAITGYTPAEVLGRNPRVLKSGQTPPAVYANLWQTLGRGEVWSGELHNRSKDGEIHLEYAVIAPVVDENGRATHYVALKDDITAQRRATAETAALLEQEHQISAMKTRFISVTSHEFRTPMAAALGSVEILAHHLDRLDPAKRAELLARITSSLHRMNEMLDEMLLLNRMDANRIEVNPSAVDLRAFLAAVIEEIRLGDRDHHRFAFDPVGDPAPVVSDRSLLHHIVSNLLSNAVRYSPAGSLITVHLDVAPVLATISVGDQGIGIPEEDRARIFEAFERGSNVGTVKGTGLGLNIVKRMTGLLGGSIALEPSTGVGSRFTLLFPPLPAPAVPR